MPAQCADARAVPRRSSEAWSPPAHVSGASYAAVAVTMAHYKVRGARRGSGRAGGAGWELGRVQGLGPAAGRAVFLLRPWARSLTRRVSSGRRLEARAVPEVLGEVGGAGHADER